MQSEILSLLYDILDRVERIEEVVVGKRPEPPAKTEKPELVIVETEADETVVEFPKLD